MPKAILLVTTIAIALATIPLFAQEPLERVKVPHKAKPFDLKQVKLAKLSGPHGTVLQVAEPGPQAIKRLKALQIDKPPKIVAWA